jgi:hypothetical protein
VPDEGPARPAREKFDFDQILAAAEQKFLGERQRRRSFGVIMSQSNSYFYRGATP